MKSNKTTKPALQDVKVHVRLKLAALWTSLMFCYIYGDYFGLFQPGNLQDMLKGRMGPLGPTTQGVLLGTSALLAVPGLMIFLSLVMKPVINRAANIVLGLLYTAVMLVSMPGAWWFYLFLGAIEIVLSLLIVWYAWRWPRDAAQ
ncbi:hypothetical protein GCM10007862_10530 [Dyella lipolytica]|uniref:DoxX-like family protein n=1 Tax=Dyella lipolytica TaxID=1867835 RepID=A0ABW8IZE6_9GAMM|nr:DUF6326 family protein [Dyella lipolytica]GLQ46002.1 hypothetical protein GCM10007862_10530 [Dyella lipolytica]